MPSRRSPMATPPLSGWPARGLTLGAIVYVRLTSPRVGSDVDLAPALTSRQLRYGVSAYYGHHKSAATQPCFRPDDVDAEVVVYRSHGELGELGSRASFWRWPQPYASLATPSSSAGSDPPDPRQAHTAPPGLPAPWCGNERRRAPKTESELYAKKCVTTSALAGWCKGLVSCPVRRPSRMPPRNPGRFNLLLEGEAGGGRGQPHNALKLSKTTRRWRTGGSSPTQHLRQGPGELWSFLP